MERNFRVAIGEGFRTYEKGFTERFATAVAPNAKDTDDFRLWYGYRMDCDSYNQTIQFYDLAVDIGYDGRFVLNKALCKDESANGLLVEAIEKRIKLYPALSDKPEVRNFAYLADCAAPAKLVALAGALYQVNLHWAGKATLAFDLERYLPSFEGLCLQRSAYAYDVRHDADIVMFSVDQTGSIGSVQMYYRVLLR